MRLMVRIVIISILISTILSPNAFADEKSAPTGISQDLWNIYQEVALWTIDGEKRNLKWNQPVGFFIRGNSNGADMTAINDNLYKIASNCNNIKPGFSSREPNEGVIIDYLPNTKFKDVIPAAPSSESNSYAWYTYYLNRGLTKFTAVIHDGIQEQRLRNWITHVRVAQGMGFGGFSANPNSTFFDDTSSNNGIEELSEIDMQLISLYCSTLIRSWETLAQTKKYIEELSQKEPNVYAFYSNNLKVIQTNYGFEIQIRPAGDLAITNGVTQIYYRVADLSGTVYKSGYIDISDNVFQQRNIFVDGLTSNKTYKIGISNVNKRGLGTFQELSERTISVSGTAPSSSQAGSNNSGTSKLTDDAKKQARDALFAVNEARSACKNFYTNYAVDTKDKIDFAINRTKLISMCETEDKEIESQEKAINEAKNIDQINEIVDKLNSLAETLDAATAEFQDAEPLLIQIGTTIMTYESSLNQIESYQSKLEPIFTKSNSAFANWFKKTKSWKQLQTALTSYYNTSKIVEGLSLDISEIDNLYELSDFTDQFEKVAKIESQFVLVQKSYTQVKSDFASGFCSSKNQFIIAKAKKCPSGFQKFKVNSNL